MAEKHEVTWGEYSRLVLTQIETNTSAIKELGDAMHALRNEMSARLGDIRLQTVRELADLENRVGVANRGEVAGIRQHFDKEIEKVQHVFDSRVSSISKNFEGKIQELNHTLTDFTKKVSDKMDTLGKEVTTLQVKMGIWGFAGGSLGVVSMWLISQLPKLIK